MRLRRLMIVGLFLLAAGCRVAASGPVVIGGAPDTRASVLAERQGAGAVQGAVPSLPEGGSSTGVEVDDLITDVETSSETATTPVLLFLEGEPLWVPRPVASTPSDAVQRAVEALAEPLRPQEEAAGLTSSVELGTSLGGWNRRGVGLELRVEGAAFAGGTASELRRRALQLACSAMVALDPVPTHVTFVGGAPLDTVAADDCPAGRVAG